MEEYRRMVSWTFYEAIKQRDKALQRAETAERERDEALAALRAAEWRTVEWTPGVYDGHCHVCDRTRDHDGGHDSDCPVGRALNPSANKRTPDRETIRELGREASAKHREALDLLKEHDGQAADVLAEGQTMAIRDLDGSEKWYRVLRVKPSGQSGQELTLEPIEDTQAN